MAPAFFTLLLVVLISNSGLAIKCLSCSSETNSTCADIAANDSSFVVECVAPDTFCRKTVQTITSASKTLVTRRCASLRHENHADDYCLVTDTNFLKETSCQCFADGCNTGSRLSHALFPSLLSALISLSRFR